MPNLQNLCPRCNRYYDSSLPACPRCSGSNDDWDDEDASEKICPHCGRSYDASLSECPRCKGDVDDWNDETKPVQDSNEDDITIGFKNPKGMAVTPVVGWLVCTVGKDKGRDFRLHVENNFVGRGVNQDVRISDQKISREHFLITYDPVEDEYSISLIKGKGIIRINGTRLSGDQILKKGDNIKVGDTNLVFIPLEKSDVTWEWD